MRAEIISVGTELLLGHIVDTNTVYLSQKLASLGIDTYYQSTVGDNTARLVAALEQALSRSDLIITTGGLGPTVDDVTLFAIGSATSRALVFNKNIEKGIIKYFKKRGIKKIPDDAKKQAHIPRGARWFKNAVGTAPGILVNYGKKILIALPGPPRELIPIFEKNVTPYLKSAGFAGKTIIKTKTLKVVGLVEVEVNKRVRDILSIGPDTTVGIYAHLGQVELKITSKAKNEKEADREIEKIEKKIRKRLGKSIYGTDNDTLESVVGKNLSKKKKTLSVAESCTGGLIGNRITNVSGSSKYFKMGLVVYSNKAKTDLLDISPQKIKKYGAVSKEVALLMAQNIKKSSGTSIALGVTGIAGPKGGTKTKPVGLVHIALVTDNKKIAKKFKFTGNREEIKHLTATHALALTISVL